MIRGKFCSLASDPLPQSLAPKEEEEIAPQEEGEITEEEEEATLEEDEPISTVAPTESTSI